MTLRVILLILCSMNFVNAQTPQRGDNIYNVFSKFDSTHLRTAFKVSNWVEGKIVFAQASGWENSDPEFLFLRSQKLDFFAVQHIKQPEYFLIDTDGDSVLDTQSNDLWLPFWVVKKNSIISKKDKSIIKLLDKTYELTLQADDGAMDESLARKYEQYRTDSSLANRHIAYLFDSYQVLLMSAYEKQQQAPAELCIPIMYNLANECVNLFGVVPAIVCIYQGEALLGADMVDEARKHFKMSLQFYPKSVPLQVYDYRLEQDPNEKQRKFIKLKKDHPNHWMVQGL